MRKLIIIKAIVLLVVIAVVASSCRTGYGCNGRSKYITGYKSSMGYGY